MTLKQENQPLSTWKVSIISPTQFLPALEEVLNAHLPDQYPTVSSFEIIGDDENWLMEGYYNAKPEEKRLITDVNNMAEIFQISPLKVILEKLEDKNWVAESQKLLKPINAGRFYLFGEHDQNTVPDNKIPILMEAGQAFGTGSHETTNGCLLAISELFDEIKPETALDLGCGSGVLAIAMAKLWDARIIASDIDPISTETTLENIKSNDVENIIALTSDGFDDETLAENSPYDLIVANILAAPLQQMAPDITDHLKEDARLILSGLLDTQEEAVLKAYQKQGWGLKKRYPINEWHTLLLGRK